MSAEPLARLQASAMRYGFAVAVGLCLGAVLAALSVGETGASRLAFGAAALLSLAMALGLVRAGRGALVLMADGIHEEGRGRLVALEDIQALDRGAFAFKPSNGFAVKLVTSQPAAWRAGLWWRFGRSLGVGGLTSAAAGKAFADQLSLLLMERDGRLPVFPES